MRAVFHTGAAVPAFIVLQVGFVILHPQRIHRAGLDAYAAAIALLHIYFDSHLPYLFVYSNWSRSHSHFTCLPVPV